MATAPTKTNLAQWNFALNDTDEVLIKDAGRNQEIDEFSDSLGVMVDSINDDLDTMEQQKTDTQTAAQAASDDAEQIALDKQAVADDRTHIDQQKDIVDTKTQQVSNDAQQVATDRQAVADDRLASEQAAGESSDAATASIQAKDDAQALYGDLDAVNTAKTEAQQAATTAGEERGLAVTAREGAETAQEAAETAASESQGAVDAALQAHGEAPDPHEQYEQKTALKAAAYRDVASGSGALMPEGFNGFGGTLPTDTDANNLYGKTQFKRLFGNSPNAPTTGSNWAILNFRRAESSDAQLALSAFGPPRSMIRTTDSNWAEHFHTLNAVGIVSESGGVPTGALVESDSNSFGAWAKWLDGTMWQWGNLADTVTISSTGLLLDGWLRSSTISYDYPQTFVGDLPAVSLTQSYVDSAGIFFNIFPAHFSVTAQAKIRMGISYLAPVAVTNAPVRISWASKGTWFSL